MEEVLSEEKEIPLFEDDLDDDLLNRLVQGEKEAFAEVVARFQRPILSYCLRMVGHVAEAEDLAQEVFLKGFRSIRGFQRRSKFSTWLYQIAHNLSLNRIRYLKRRRPVEFSEEERGAAAEPMRSASFDSPEEAVIDQERRRHLSEAIGFLGSSYREVIILRDIEGLPYEEIARVLGTTVGTIKSRLHRARIELMESMRRRKAL